MTDKEIYSKIEEIYNSEKGKGFITHLLRSFFPVNKAHYAFFNEEGRKYVCCITGDKLGTKEDLFEVTMSEEGRNALWNDFMERTKAIADGKESYEHSEEVIELRKKIKPLAVVCEKSNKCLSIEAFQQLQNFYFSELLRGNKHINWVSNNERSKEFIKEMKKDGVIKKKKEEKVVRKVVEHSGGMTLGELDTLKELKKRMGG